MSVNEVCQHGIPSEKKVLKEGDIISIDIGACYKGYHGDSAWTYSVGKISKENKRLLQVTEDALYAGLKKVQANNRVQDISNEIQNCIYKAGFSIPEEFTGHGIGTSVHEDPFVPNIGTKGRSTRLRVGMTLAIEPIAHYGKPNITVLKDKWTSISSDRSNTAHFEHTVVITEYGFEILTKEE